MIMTRTKGYKACAVVNIVYCSKHDKPFGDVLFCGAKHCHSLLLVVTNSRRICAIHFIGKGISLLCVCVYMPYESDSTSVDEFHFQLSTVDSVISQCPDSHIILGGDCNVDLSTNWTNTKVLDDYCLHACLFPVIRYENSTVDYKHHFNMKYFGSIDHLDHCF